MKTNLEGLRFGRWLVTGIAGIKYYPSGAKQFRYACICNCGNTKIVVASCLKSGASKSCGCLNKEIRSKLCSIRNTKHGLHGSVEYKVWQSMVARCHCAGASGYKKYGAKGLSVCDRWRHSFETFLADMGVKPYPDASIERINPFGNYEPRNCKWIHLSEQQANKRNSSITTIYDMQVTIKNFCAAKNITVWELFGTLT